MPIVGVIEPGLRAALRATRNGRDRRHRHGRHDRLGRLPARRGRAPIAVRRGALSRLPGLRRVRRAGEIDSDQVHVLAERLLAPLVEVGVDTLLLGCTHYPFLARTIGDVMGREVVLVSSADETAFEVRAILVEHRPRPARRRRRPSIASSPRATSSGSPRWVGALLGPELDQRRAPSTLRALEQSLVGLPVEPVSVRRPRQRGATMTTRASPARTTDARSTSCARSSSSATTPSSRPARCSR